MATVKVAQESGDIGISTEGDPPVTFAVTKGKAEVPQEHLAKVLAHIRGAELVNEKPAAVNSGVAQKG